MPTLVPRRRTDGGFTLVELLVAILIVGILAAIAIPAFLNTIGGASDVPATAMVSTARLAARTLAMDNNGSFATVSRQTLPKYEPTIVTSKAHGDAYLSAAQGTPSTYTLTVKSTATGDAFSFARFSDGTISRTCKLAKANGPHGVCKNVRGRNGTW